MSNNENRSGFFEELHHRDKHYPEQSRIIPIKPSELPEVFTQQIAQQINNQFQFYAQHEQYDKIVEMYNKIEQLLNENTSEIQSPVSKVQYWFENEILPILPSDFHLTQPNLVTNQEGHSNNLIHALKKEMLTADGVDIIVSFLRISGVQKIMRILTDLVKKKKVIRLITSTYLNITQPEAIRKLLTIEGVQIKVFQSEQISFHTKAYIFHRNSGLHSTIIGSSNLSHSALETGIEWNVKLPATSHSLVYLKACEHFSSLWTDPLAIEASEEWLNHYENQLTHKIQPSVPVQKFSEEQSPYGIKQTPVTTTSIDVKIKPTEMQEIALEALIETRKNGNMKGVIIAATGTGKTYLSAFDVARFNPKRMLFLAHRDELLENARNSFIHVMGEPGRFGKLTGQVKESDRPYLFSTVQTFHREINSYQPNYFDYIIVDEFHHAEAATYRKIIDHFQPKFLLGLTATPERMDGGDVLALCDYNVVYEIRLHQALQEKLLCPFHYFGLSDETIDYEQIKMENGQFNIEQLSRALSTGERVDYVISMIEKFGHDGKQRKALGFCASIEHAQFMTKAFNENGFISVCLTGQDDPNYRREIIERLESDSDSLEFIFTVNIFNEGVDIPKLNLLLFLRPTESATIFLQQLGRGLRKAENKEFVTILDFIGNYNKSFLVPLALSGQTNQKAFDRDLLRSVVQHDFIHLPDGCYVDLEQIARQRILDKIDQIRMDANQMLKNLYDSFKNELGKSPEIEDFLYVPSAPSLHYFIRKYGSWVETKKRMNDLNTFDEKIVSDQSLMAVIQRLEQMLPIKWPYEFIVLQSSLATGKLSLSTALEMLHKQFGIELDQTKQIPYFLRAMKNLQQTVKGVSFGTIQSDVFHFNSSILSYFTQTIFSNYLKKRLEFGLKEFRRTYRPSKFFEGEIPIVHYQNYTRNELIYLFQSEAPLGSWREGISKVRNHYLFFVTLRKGSDVEKQLNYNDYFMDQKTFHWQSANQDAHRSKRGQDYVNHLERGISIHLFVRKFKEMYSQTLPFMYCGKLIYVRSDGDQPMNMVWRLEKPLPEEIYFDFIT